MHARKKLINGQTLLATIIGIVIFLLLANAVFSLIKGSYLLTSFNRARITARHLAQEKIEIIKNLPYENIGTIGGIPNGPLEQEETIRRNGLTYTVSTDVVYVDDEFDNTAPNDLLPTDYKRVRVAVSWEGIAKSRKNPVVFVTDIAPRGVETTVGGGTLSILVFNANGNPVPQAEVQIRAPNTNPPVNLTLQTAANGRIILPGAPACTSCYQITATKNGFSVDRTYSTSEVANPTKPHQTVLEGQLTEASFTIDRTSTLTINTTNNRESNFSPLGNITLNIRGTKIIGTDTNDNPVYKYSNSFATNSEGNLVINNLEWDNYSISLPANSNYTFSGTNPFTPITIIPNANTNLRLALSSRTPNSLLIRFTNSSNVPIASVSATLRDNGSFNQTILSGQNTDPDYGQVFFDSLSNANYYLYASASGFLEVNTTIPVSGQTIYDVILSQ
ncbi:MAG: carboxypeptidase-like regulatory domain-containing protein [Patescibacteria group bacterium]|nr:carboxypeptidase-like regulatory domain-containing protein [Patescibacteria group bacterium]